MLNLLDVLTAFDAKMDQLSIGGQRLITNVGRQESAVARYSLLDVLLLLDASAQQIVSRVRSHYLRSYVETKAPTAGVWDLTDSLRLMRDTPRYGTGDSAIQARRRTLSFHDQTQLSSNAAPNYTYEKNLFTIRADTNDPDEVRADFVMDAVRTAHQEGGVYTAGTGVVALVGVGGGDPNAFVAGSHVGAPIFATVGGTVHTGKILSVASESEATCDFPTLTTNEPVVVFDYYTFGFLKLDARFKIPVVELAAAIAFQSEGEVERFEASIQTFLKLIEPFKLETLAIELPEDDI